MKKAKKTAKKTATKKKVTKKPSKDKTNMSMTAEQLQAKLDEVSELIPLPMASDMKLLCEVPEKGDPTIQMGIVWAFPVRKRKGGSDFFEDGEPLEHVRGYAQMAMPVEKALNPDNYELLLKSTILSAILAYNGESTPSNFCLTE
jgi:hypothetical protein